MIKGSTDTQGAPLGSGATGSTGAHITGAQGGNRNNWFSSEQRTSQGANWCYWCYRCSRCYRFRRSNWCSRCDWFSNINKVQQLRCVLMRLVVKWNKSQCRSKLTKMMVDLSSAQADGLLDHNTGSTGAQGARDGDNESD